MIRGKTSRRYHVYLVYLVSLAGLVVLLVSGCTASSEPVIPPTTTAIPTPTAAEAAESDVITDEIHLQQSRLGADEKTLRLMFWDAPKTLNPHLSPGLKDFEAGRITLEPLASFDTDGETLVPFLAAEIPTRENGGLAEDGMSVTWKLKEGVQWSDGEPFTADDVLFTYEFITDPDIKSHAATSYGSVDHVEVIDDYTVKVWFKDPTRNWAVPFVGRYGLIIPRHTLGDYGTETVRDAPENTEEAVGTGPYRVVSFKAQEVLFLGTDLVETNKIVFERNPFFRGPQEPYFDWVELRGGGTAKQAARAVLVDGASDYVNNLQVSDEELREMQEEGDHGSVIRLFGSKLLLLELNATDPDKGSVFPDTKHPILDDKNVRQAISYAIDREEIAAEAFGESGMPASNILVGGRYDEIEPAYTHDLDKALELLEEAGWTDSNDDGILDQDGEQIQLLYRAKANEQDWQIQQLVKEQLREVGIEIELDPVESRIFVGGDQSYPNTVEKFSADMQHWVTPRPAPDPLAYLGLWRCDQIPTPDNNWSGWNTARWCNETFDSLYEQANTELDPDERHEILLEMNDIFVDDAYMLLLVRIANVSAAGNDIEGIDLTPWDADVWNIKDWKRSSAP